MRITLVMLILGAFALIGTLNTMAFADSGNTQITDLGAQGGVSFDVLDPDGIKTIVELANGQSCPGQVIEVNLDCSDPQVTHVDNGPFDGIFCIGPDDLTIVEITDCQADMSTSTWMITSFTIESRAEATCIENCDPPQPPVVGGEILPIETTTLLLAAAQSPAWLTALTITALGIGAYVFTRNQNNIRNAKAILRYYLDRF